MSQKLDPRIKALCDKVTSKRPRTVIQHILEHGHITTEELQTLYNYDHPPRAAADVRDNGIPLETFYLRSDRTGRKIAAYRFGDPSKIQKGRIGGRNAFSKKFKEALLAKYESRDAITGIKMNARYLQIDHRVPYRVAGDSQIDESNLDEYMLLDASSQRTKSWSCENCTNWQDKKDEAVCKNCYWAFPENYTHIALEEVRRIDLEFRGKDAKEFDKIREISRKTNTPVEEIIKSAIKEIASKR